MDAALNTARTHAVSMTTSVPARMVQHNKHTVCITAAAIRALVSTVLPVISCRMTAFGSAVTKQ